MFHFSFSRRPASAVPGMTALPAASVPGLAYFDFEPDGPQVTAESDLSRERAALDQAFGYWSER